MFDWQRCDRILYARVVQVVIYHLWYFIDRATSIFVYIQPEWLYKRTLCYLHLCTKRLRLLLFLQRCRVKFLTLLFNRKGATAKTWYSVEHIIISAIGYDKTKNRGEGWFVNKYSRIDYCLSVYRPWLLHTTCFYTRRSTHGQYLLLYYCVYSIRVNWPIVECINKNIIFDMMTSSSFWQLNFKVRQTLIFFLHKN